MVSEFLNSFALKNNLYMLESTVYLLDSILLQGGFELYIVLLLFLAAFTGAYVGIFFPVTAYGFMLASLITGILAACPLKPLYRLSLLLVTVGFLSTGLSQKSKNDFDNMQKQLPSHEVVWEGKVEDVNRRIDGSLVGYFFTSGYFDNQTHFSLQTRLQFHLFEEAATLHVEPGDTIRVGGVAWPLHKAFSPGELDPYLLGLSRLIQGSINAYSIHKVMLLPQAAGRSLMAQWRFQLKKRILQQLTPRESALILALVDGDTTLFDDDQLDIYRQIGAGHLLAVSGLQISLIAFLLFTFFHRIFVLIPSIGRLSLARIYAAFVSLFLVMSFVAFCGASPSAVRAGMMSALALLGIAFGLQSSLAKTFGAAGTLAVLFYPPCVLDPSFLLSYGAIFGLILYRETPSFSRIILPVFLSSFVVSLIVLPLSAHLFGQIALGGILANAFIIPIASFLQMPSIFLGIPGAVFYLPFLTQIAASFAGILEAFCETLGLYLGHLSYIEAPSGLMTVLWILAAGFLCMGIFYPYRRTGFVSALICILLASHSLFFCPHGLHITVLPIGQGDASFFEFPSGHTLLVDGGGSLWGHGKNPGEKVLTNFLQRQHIDHIDVVIASHPHPDHVLGLITVLKKWPVKELWYNGASEEDFLTHLLLETARERKIPTVTAADLLGEHFFGKSRLQVLGPHHYQKKLGENNNSMVFSVTHEGKSVLWPGDIEEEGEMNLLRDYPFLPVHILKAPHHGSKTSSTQAFINATQPQHVIFCTGPHNSFGFPHGPIIDRYKNAHTALWNTAENGEISIWLTQEGIQIFPFIASPLGQLAHV